MDVQLINKVQFKLYKLVKSKNIQKELKIIEIINFNSKAPAFIILTKPILVPVIITAILLIITAASKAY